MLSPGSTVTRRRGLGVQGDRSWVESLETSLLEFTLARIAAHVSHMIFPPSNAKASFICLKHAAAAACCLGGEGGRRVQCPA